jgi:hypothetical protein
MRKIIASCFIVFLLNSVYGAHPVKDDSSHIEVLLSKQMLSDAGINADFISSFDITSSRHILLSSTNQFYLLGWGGINTIGYKMTDTISSFAFTSDSIMMLIHNKCLCYIDTTGNLIKLHSLPNSEMGISGGKDAMYIYDSNKNLEQCVLYSFNKSGQLDTLFIAPTPITAVVEIDQSLIFSTENCLFAFSLQTQELNTIAIMEKGQKIISIAIDASKHNIYFSTENSVNEITGTTWGTLSSELGGTLKYVDDGLLVFNAGKKFLVRVGGKEKQ